MKKIFYLSILILAVAVTGCQKDFLTKAPLDSINTANYFKTETDAVNAINGAYQPLQWPKLYNMRMWTSDIYAGNSVVGAGGGTDGIETQEEANFITAPDNPGVLDLWRGPWPGILSCNLVLAKVPAINFDATTKNRILGEAHFLRGLYYFILVRYFGGVPLVLKPVNPGDDLRPFRNTKEQVYNQIIADFSEAIKLLPTRDAYSGSDVGRASRGAAEGMLAKVYLTLGNWQRVVNLCDSVGQLGYALDANYADNFNPATKNSTESLFEIQYSGSTAYSFWSNQNQASWTSIFMGPRGSNMVAGGGWGWNQPTKEFVDSYEPGDKRKDVTILYEGCPKFNGMDYDSTWSTTGYNVRKFLVPSSVASSYDDSPEDFPVLRYADVLLMDAEALNELGQTTASEQPLNEVRARAGLPAIHGLSQSDMKAKILHERRMELAFEGQRWFDLIRVDNGQYGINFLHSIGKLNMSTKYLVMPIPQVDIDANPNLAQNPGY
ncbi:MAG: RagB/SusD family nutrient uptake outer membrane protein [Bacteroidales bacterium]|nr:RagB/SusD family nutrient uptake outer membrane protein [Bacteroidales bacterium]